MSLISKNIRTINILALTSITVKTFKSNAFKGIRLQNSDQKIKLFKGSQSEYKLIEFRFLCYNIFME